MFGEMENSMTGMCVLLGVLTLLAMIDLKTETVPVYILLSATVAGIVLYHYGKPFSLYSLVGGIALGGGLLLIAVLTKEKIGIGDGLVFCMTGVFLGAGRNLALLMMASVLSAGTAGFLLLLRKCSRQNRIPFVPFILFADAVMMIMEVASR